MATQTPQTPLSKTDELENNDELENVEGTDLANYSTTDSYDANIIPAEVAARKEREDGKYKHLAENPPGSESIDTTGGFTMDKEGLVDNFGIEPEMYYETPGDAKEAENSEPEPLDR
jgi:hypothetical protein